MGVGLLGVMGVAGSFVHVVNHADGPMIPRPAMLGPMLHEFMYLVVVFIFAGVIGHLARKDDKRGLGELFDVSPAPHWVRLVGRVLTLLGVTLFFALIPGIAGFIVTLLAAPGSLTTSTYLWMSILGLFPALLEISALVFLSHAMIRPAGPAYAFSMFLAFVLILNHELKLATYPQLELGIPVHLTYSELTGWGQWLAPLLGGMVFKVSLSVCLFCLAGLVWPRGSERNFADMRKRFLHRLKGSLSVVAALALAVMAGMAWFAYQQYVVHGNYKTLSAELASDAAWERQWLKQKSAFSVTGGQVKLQLMPQTGQVKGSWKLEGIKAAKGLLHASTPDGFALQKASCGGTDVPHRLAQDHLMLKIKGCQGKALELRWSLHFKGWSSEGVPARMTRSGFWLRAIDLMPRLGMAGNRVLRSPAERKKFGLGNAYTLPTGKQTPSAQGVAPAGSWSWQITARQKGLRWSQKTQGPLNFGVFWSPRATNTTLGGYQISHGPSHQTMLKVIASDATQMKACVERRLGLQVALQKIVQIPRGMGQIEVIDSTLWMPEDKGWDVASQGAGHWLRRAEIARAMARSALLSASHLREVPGNLWLTSGAAGAIGILCVGQRDGVKAFQTLLSRGADRSIEALSASVVPVTSLASARPSDWAHAYAPLAALYWTSKRTPVEWQQITKKLRQGEPLRAVLGTLDKELPVDLMLGPPNASDVALSSASAAWKIQRWKWRKGGWRSIDPRASRPWKVKLSPSIKHDKSSSMVLDRWCSFERTPADNAARGKGGHTPPP